MDILETDVLIIGGGFAGCWAALRAADLGATVTLVDKAYVSRSGASTMSGGITTCPLDSDDLDVWAEEFIVRGSYMCDQRWTYQLLEGQRQRIKDYERWNVPISRADDGSIRRFASRGMVNVRGMQYQPKVAMRELRRQITARDVRILDRVFVTELLTVDGAWPTRSGIAGAVGFDVYSGTVIALKAKRTIAATGMIAMKGTHRVDNDCGDGAAMAFRAGGRLVDMEFTFGGTFNVLMKKFDFPSYNVAVAHGARLINARGERFMQQYDPVRLERSELSHVVAAFAKEIIAGRGPVFIDLRHVDDSYWSDIAKLHRGGSILLTDHVPDPKINPLPIEPTWGLWASGRSGLHIDLGARTNLPGLLAAGSVAKNDATGTHASAGSPTAFCNVSGWHAGETAARESRECPMPAIASDVLNRLREQALAPLRRPASRKSADDLHDDLARLESSVVHGMILNRDRLQCMLETTEQVLEEARHCHAVDLHDLVKLHEARNVATCSGVVYRAALDRTESREQFFREDYPLTDPSWFCWHGATLGADGRVVFDRQSFPNAGARFPLPQPQAGGLSPIAAIIRGQPSLAESPL
ncbi:MAG: FAD-binding protein [Hyphomicrobiales bacterium]|nr:FAD-binding protein [Hyphomicrobiales bacterium]